MQDGIGDLFERLSRREPCWHLPQTAEGGPGGKEYVLSRGKRISGKEFQIVGAEVGAATRIIRDTRKAGDSTLRKLQEADLAAAGSTDESRGSQQNQ